MEFFFNICCLIASFIALLAGVRFWKSNENTGISQFRNYSLNFLFLSLAFLLLFFPNLILFNSTWIQVNFVLVDLCFLFGELFLVVATLSFLKYSEKIKKIFFIAFFLIVLLYISLNIMLFAPAISIVSNGIYYWKNGIFWLHSLVWIPAASGAGVIGGWFLWETRKIKDNKALYWRSISFGLTGVLISVAGIFFWYFKFFSPSSTILMASGIIGDLGFMSGVIGSFLYQKSQELFVKKVY